MRERDKTDYWKTLLKAAVRTAAFSAGILLALIAGTLLVLWSMKGTGLRPQTVPPAYQVLDASTEAVSDYLLNITDVEAIGLEPVAEWLERCEECRGDFHCLIYTDPDSWDAFLYLPGLTQKIGNQNVSISIENAEAGKTLVVYLNTQDLSRTAEPKEQLLHFAAPLRGAWPNYVQVIQDGEERVQTSSCMYTNNGWFWDEKMENQDQGT